jgi:hypothetical protein
MSPERKNPPKSGSAAMLGHILRYSQAKSFAEDPPLEVPMAEYDGPERREGSDRRRPDGIKFDKTINLGHVLSMAAMIAAVMASWSLMDKRVVVLEVTQNQQAAAQRERDSVQDSSTREKFGEVREGLADLRRSVEKIADKVGAR